MMVLVIFIATGRDNSFFPGCPSVHVQACGHVRTGMISPIPISHTAHEVMMPLRSASAVRTELVSAAWCYLPGGDQNYGAMIVTGLEANPGV